MKEQFMGYLSKTLNLDNEQLADLLYKKSDDGTPTDEIAENALSELLRLDAERVQKLKPDTKTIFDNGYKKAQSEVSERWEKTLREKFGIEQQDMKGDAIIDAILSRQSEGGMKPEKVKMHPEYLALEAAMRRQEAELKEQYAAEVEKVKSEFTREQTWQSVSKEIKNTVMGLNPILPGDAAKADRMLSLFLEQNFRGYEYAPDGNGGFVVMKDGQRVENQHGHVKVLQDLAREAAEMYFDFNVQKPAGNAGNSGAGGGTNTLSIKSEEDFYKAWASAAGDPAKQKTVSAAWKASQAAGAN